MLTKERSRLGRFGGCFTPELLMQPLLECHRAFENAKQDVLFQSELRDLLNHYAGRMTPLTPVPRFQTACGGPELFLKREDCLHTGAHKINNALGQCLLAKKMGKKRVIAETGAGQHGVATATACARLGLECEIYMGAVDVERQQPNVAKMQLLGAKVHAVYDGQQTLKEAVNAAMRVWAASFPSTFYCLGSALGPHPYPKMVAYFQSIIGQEVRTQCLDQGGRLPTVLIACVGGGSNAIGLFNEFVDDPIRFIGVEAGGDGERHAARISAGSPGVLHGCYSYLLQNADGQVAETFSISAGMDYPMIGPHHADFYESGRAEYHAVKDTDVLMAFKLLVKTEGIIPALESSHALAYYQLNAHRFSPNDRVVINLSGRGDKDLPSLYSEGLLP
jgi:tryptophan synthase beta subunit